MGDQSPSDNQPIEPPFKKGTGVSYAVVTADQFETLDTLEDNRRRKGQKAAGPTVNSGYEDLLPTKAKRPPPIRIPTHYDSTQQRNIPSTDSIRAAVSNITNDYNIRNDAAEVRILCENPSNHQRIVNELKKLKIYYFTHPTDQKKHKRFVLYGLEKLDTDDLTSHLDSAGVKPVKITYMTARNPRFNDQCNYILHFEWTTNTTLSQLKTVRSLNHTMVYWAHYKPKESGVGCCRNCSKFGHGARDCGLPPKCIFCSSD